MGLLHPTFRWDQLHDAGNGVIALRGRHDRSIAIHAHDFWELQLGVAGSARHETPEGVSDFVRGSIVLLRPGVWHRKERCAGLISWACCWSTTTWQGLLAPAAADPRLSTVLRQAGSAGMHRLSEAATRRCLGHLAAISAASPLARGALVLLVLDELARALAPAVAQTPVPGELVAVLDAIDADPGKPWSVAGIAHHTGYSLAHCARCCRMLTGSGLQAYITSRRLERAIAMLSGGMDSVAAVAQACGFSDQAYFSRCFRQHHGMTPRSWRQLHAR